MSADGAAARPPMPRLAVVRGPDVRHALDVGGTPVVVAQRTERPAPDYEVLFLAFETPVEVRFALDLAIPAECRNACVTLDDEVLLDWFADEVPASVPEDLRAPRPACGCADCAAAAGPGAGSGRFSPLLPGRVQALVFRWHPGDVLRLHLVGPYGR